MPKLWPHPDDNDDKPVGAVEFLVAVALTLWGWAMLAGTLLSWVL